ncbi:MAG TPA: hypothetical protein VEK06_01100, partial [Myxococcota bacterium]|nr:hypothetical protein [Myxococcota bacterium]
GTIEQNFSHITRVYGTISLPDNYKAGSLPKNGFIDGEGVSGRFLVDLREQTLYFDGESVLTLPLGKNHHQVLAQQRKELQSLGETRLEIAMVDNSGGIDGEKPVSAENN